MKSSGFQVHARSVNSHVTVLCGKKGRCGFHRALVHTQGANTFDDKGGTSEDRQGIHSKIRALQWSGALAPAKAVNRNAALESNSRR